MNLPSTHISTDATLVIFCKRPKLNQGKQRLVNDSNAENALTIAKALLNCALEDARNWRGPVILACSNQEDMAWAHSVNQSDLANGAFIMLQLPEGETGNLGKRLNYIDKTLRQSSHKQLIFIGTDAPMLTPEHYRSTLKVLQTNNIVLNHADDGGVVIMANNLPWPPIEHLPWSTDKLSLSLLTVCTEHRLTVAYALPGYDIDYIADIKRLYNDIQTDSRPARQALIQTINDLSLSPKASKYA